MQPRVAACLRATLSDGSASSYNERYSRTTLESQNGSTIV